MRVPRITKVMDDSKQKKGSKQKQSSADYVVRILRLVLQRREMQRNDVVQNSMQSRTR